MSTNIASFAMSPSYFYIPPRQPMNLIDLFSVSKIAKVSELIMCMSMKLFIEQFVEIPSDILLGSEVCLTTMVKYKNSEVILESVIGSNIHIEVNTF